MGSQTVGAAYFMSEGQDASYEVVRGNGFNIIIEGLDVSLKAYATNLPEGTVDTPEVYHGNEKSKYASTPSFDDLRVEIYDLIGQSTVADLWTWWKQVYNPQTGQIGFANEYKRRVIIEIVDSKGATIRTWFIAGCIIKRQPTPDENMAMDKPEAIRMSLVCSVDWMSLDGFNRNSGVGALS